MLKWVYSPLLKRTINKWLEKLGCLQSCTQTYFTGHSDIKTNRNMDKSRKQLFDVYIVVIKSNIQIRDDINDTMLQNVATWRSSNKCGAIHFSSKCQFTAFAIYENKVAFPPLFIMHYFALYAFINWNAELPTPTPGHDWVGSGVQLISVLIYGNSNFVFVPQHGSSIRE